MKLEISGLKTKFTQIRVTFICETQNELNALGSIFNSTRIMDSVLCVFECTLHELTPLFKEAGSEVQLAGALNNMLKSTQSP